MATPGAARADCEGPDGVIGEMVHNGDHHVMQYCDGNLRVGMATGDAGSIGVTDGDKGDVSVSGTGSSWTMDSNAVSYVKLQNTSAASVLLGRGSAAGAGAVEEITVGSGLTVTGTVLSAASDGHGITALTGDVTASGAGSVVATIANNAVTLAKILDGKIATADLANGVVSYAKLLRDQTSIIPVGEVELFTDNEAQEPLEWGRDRIGIGLLTALRRRRRIVFSDRPSPDGTAIRPVSGHVVVCEQGEAMSEVIATNYAHALRAGLCLIPNITRHDSEDVLERFYGAYDPGGAFLDHIRGLRDELLGHLEGLVIPEGGSVTFVTGGLPYGFSITDHPSTHLFKYPESWGAGKSTASQRNSRTGRASISLRWSILVRLVPGKWPPPSAFFHLVAE